MGVGGTKFCNPQIPCVALKKCLAVIVCVCVGGGGGRRALEKGKVALVKNGQA